jgi:hypothetical protein
MPQSKLSWSPLHERRDRAQGYTPPATGFSVKDLARRWLVGEDKIRTWLKRGELVGVNVALTMCGRPMWRIPAEEVQRFEQRRSSTPSPKPAKRRQRVAHIDFYPD